MSVSRIPKNTVVKIDGEGTGVVKSSKFEIDETIYDVKIEGISICLPFSQYRLEIVPAKKQTMASTSSRFQSVGASDINKFVNNKKKPKTLSKKLCDMNLLKLFQRNSK